VEGYVRAPDPHAGEAHPLTDVPAHSTAVLLNWATWPYLIACLSGLQSINGLSTWGATIIKSLGFSSITANLLNAPGPIIAGTLGLVLSSLVDRYKRYGYAILFVGIWTLAGIIALYVSPTPETKPSSLRARPNRYHQHLPVTSKTSWSFYAAYLVTQASPYVIPHGSCPTIEILTALVPADPGSRSMSPGSRSTSSRRSSVPSLTPSTVSPNGYLPNPSRPPYGQHHPPCHRYK